MDEQNCRWCGEPVKTKGRDRGQWINKSIWYHQQCKREYHEFVDELNTLLS